MSHALPLDSQSFYTHHLQLAWGGKNWEMKELYYLVGIGFTSQLKDLELYSIKVYNNSLMAAAIA
jgi:hypothetical protein